MKNFNCLICRPKTSYTHLIGNKSVMFIAYRQDHNSSKLINTQRLNLMLKRPICLPYRSIIHTPNCNAVKTAVINLDIAILSITA